MIINEYNCHRSIRCVNGMTRYACKFRCESIWDYCNICVFRMLAEERESESITMSEMICCNSWRLFYASKK